MDMVSTSTPTPTADLAPAWSTLERDPERDFLFRAQRGDRRARERLVETHRRLVVAVARRSGFRGASLDDAVHEGIVGLLEAIDRFDVERDNRFATYATYWVLDRIRRHGRESRALVRAPSTRAARVVLRGHGRAFRALSNELGREPTRAEIAARLEVDEAEVARCEPSLGGADVSFDAFEPNDPRAHVVDGASSPEDTVAEAEARLELQRRVEVALAQLAPRERIIVERRFLADDESSLSELGELFGISRERARQIQEGARSKLRRALEA